MPQRPDPLRAGAMLQIQPDAPVLVRLETEIEAPAERVWEHLLAVEQWSRWHPGMDFAKLEAEKAAPGVRLIWRADGMRISSILQEVDPHRTVSWSLRTLGGRGHQRWTLEEIGLGRTLLRTEESWSGIFPFLLRRTLERTLRASRTAWLDGLREAAEAPGGPLSGETPWPPGE